MCRPNLVSIGLNSRLTRLGFSQTGRTRELNEILRSSNFMPNIFVKSFSGKVAQQKSNSRTPITT